MRAIIVVTSLCMAFVIGACGESSEKFNARLIEIADSIESYSGTTTAMSSVLSSNWRSAIFDKQIETYVGGTKYVSDFNDALRMTMEDYDFMIKVIKSRTPKVDSMMKTIKEAPEKSLPLKRLLVDYYTLYQASVDKALQPSGSLQTYSAEINKLESDLKNKRNEIKAAAQY